MRRWTRATNGWSPADRSPPRGRCKAPWAIDQVHTRSVDPSHAVIHGTRTHAVAYDDPTRHFVPCRHRVDGVLGEDRSRRRLTRGHTRRKDAAGRVLRPAELGSAAIWRSLRARLLPPVADGSRNSGLRSAWL